MNFEEEMRQSYDSFPSLNLLPGKGGVKVSRGRSKYSLKILIPCSIMSCYFLCRNGFLISDIRLVHLFFVFNSSNSSKFNDLHAGFLKILEWKPPSVLITFRFDLGSFLGLCETDNKEFNWLWDHKKKDIEDQYPGYALQLISNENVLGSLSIRVDKTPITYCLQGSAQEKEGFVGLVHKNEMKFIDLMEALHREGSGKRKNSHPGVQ